MNSTEITVDNRTFYERVCENYNESNGYTVTLGQNGADIIVTDTNTQDTVILPSSGVINSMTSYYPGSDHKQIQDGDFDLDYMSRDSSGRLNCAYAIAGTSKGTETSDVMNLAYEIISTTGNKVTKTCSNGYSLGGTKVVEATYNFTVNHPEVSTSIVFSDACLNYPTEGEAGEKYAEMVNTLIENDTTMV